MDTRTYERVIGGAIILTAFGTIVIGRQISEQRVEALEEKAELLEGKAGLLEEQVGRFEKITQRTQEGFENYFKEYESAKETMLNTAETRVLQGALEKKLTQSETEKNLCKIFLTSYDKKTDDTVARGQGNGIYLTPSLVLTAYHVIDSEKKDFYDQNVFVYATDGRVYHMQDLVAISPRYDLALIRTNKAFADAEEIAVQMGEYTGKLELQSCGNEWELSCTPTKETLTIEKETDDLLITINGKRRFPSIEIRGVKEHGFSGSPVFQDNALIGLLVQGVTEGSIVSNHVYDFITRVVEEGEQ